MAEDDIYNNKAKYEYFKEHLNLFDHALWKELGIKNIFRA